MPFGKMFNFYFVLFGITHVGKVNNLLREENHVQMIKNKNAPEIEKQFTIQFYIYYLFDCTTYSA